MTTPVTVDGLTYTYPGTTGPAVRDVTFSIAAGEIFGFLGPSGAGKTTTQHILTGLIAGWTGTVAIHDRSPAEWGRSLYDTIGVSFELPAGYASLTAREDLHHFAALHQRPARPIDDLLTSLGLGENADQQLGAYSKGMRVRLNLARALLHRPDVLFLDEPTSGLDPVTTRLVRWVIGAERDRGAAVFLTTHDMATAEALCDRVAFMVEGTIAACDTPRALRMANSPRQARIEYQAGHGLESETVALDRPDRLAELIATHRIEAIHTLERGLDDVFADVTGSRL